jgi:hypothetical protein
MIFECVPFNNKRKDYQPGDQLRSVYKTPFHRYEQGGMTLKDSMEPIPSTLY